MAWSAPRTRSSTPCSTASLVRQGETIHMKHIVRQPIARGWLRRRPSPGRAAALNHRGSDTKYDLPLAIDDERRRRDRNGPPPRAPRWATTTPSWSSDAENEGEQDTLWTGQSFKVDEYKLPTIREGLRSPDPRTPPCAQALPLDLFVGYLSGGGAAQPARRDARRLVRRRHGPPTAMSGYSFGGRAADRRAPSRSTATARTDEDRRRFRRPRPCPSRSAATAPRRTSIEVPQSLDQTTNMQIEMDYQDANGEILTAVAPHPDLHLGSPAGRSRPTAG